MDSSEPPGRPPPRQELRGPQPTRTKVRKVQKTPMAPPPPQPRPPVIIYTDSPKVIHTTPSDFMSLVQRLTGPPSSSSSSSNAAAAASPSPSNVKPVGETSSSAAPLAAIEEGARTSHDEGPSKNGEDVFDQLGIDGDAPDFFWPSMDPNSLNLMHEPSPAFDANNLLTTPAEPPPADYCDPFSQYPDFDLFDP